MVISPRCSFSTSMKRLMCVPLKWWGRLTDIVRLAHGLLPSGCARSSTTIG